MPDKLLNWKFVDEFRVERPDIAGARMHSVELGIEPVSAAVGAQLAFVAAASAATSIIEIGTGLGVSALWLMSGAPNATLTTIDSELDYQQVARGFLVDAGVPTNRIRLIGGRAAEVLPRMNESSYDLVFVDGDPASVVEYVEHGLRLARPGGTVLVAHALWRDRVADPAQRDDIVAGYRILLNEIASSDAVVAALSPAGDGLLQLVKVA